MAFRGEVHPRWVTRDEFYNNKDLDLFDKMVFSFGSRAVGRRTYFASDARCDIEKRVWDGVITLEDAKQEAYKKGLSKPDDFRCAPIARWNRIHALKKSPEILSKISFSSLDYHDYKYQEGDVVYCDIPYELTKTGNKEFYGSDFDTDAFFEWASAQPYPVFVSSYLRGMPVWTKKTLTCLSSASNNLVRVEAVLQV